MLRLLSLLSLPLWGLPFTANAERGQLDLESEALGSEEAAAAERAPEEEKAKQLLASLVVQCVLKEMGLVESDQNVATCKKYKTLKDLLQKQSDANEELAKEHFVTRLAGMARAAAKLDDIQECLDVSGKAWPALEQKFKACQEEKVGELDNMVKHFVKEMDQCSQGAVSTSACDAAKCGEGEGQMCPEGTACECYSETDAARARKYGFATWAGIASTKLAIGAMLGLAGVIPGGVLVAAGAVYACPTGDTATVLSVSAAMSQVPACGCQMQPCKVVKGKCAIVPKAKVSNPYAKLPPLGFKCSLERDSCTMKQCEQDDMKDRKVGSKESDLFNCNPEFLQFPKLPSGAENNAANRNRLYHDKTFIPA